MEEMSKLRKQLLQLVFNQSSGLQQDFSWSHGTIEGGASRPLVGLIGLQNALNKFQHQRETEKFMQFAIRLVWLEKQFSSIGGRQSLSLPRNSWSLCSFSTPLSDPKSYYDPLIDQVFSWVTPTFGPHLWQLPLHGVPIVDDVQRVVVFAFSLLGGDALPCLRSVRKFMAASPASILRPDASGQRRVGNLLNKLKTRLRIIDCCAMLKVAWNENPMELHSEILGWFQECFRD
ncbi:RNA helicase [Sarracenia purpurea var. burkii]